MPSPTFALVPRCSFNARSRRQRRPKPTGARIFRSSERSLPPWNWRRHGAVQGTLRRTLLVTLSQTVIVPTVRAHLGFQMFVTSRLYRPLALILAAGGCSSSADESTDLTDVQSTRDALCSKLSCATEPALTACVDDLDQQITQAQADSCLSILDVWLRCLNTSVDCVDGQPPTTASLCSAEEERAEDCRKGRLR